MEKQGSLTINFFFFFNSKMDAKKAQPWAHRQMGCCSFGDYSLKREMQTGIPFSRFVFSDPYIAWKIGKFHP